MKDDLKHLAKSGEFLWFYGANRKLLPDKKSEHTFEFGEHVYLVTYDDCDGYRSTWEGVEIVEVEKKYPHKLCKCRVVKIKGQYVVDEYSTIDRGYVLEDKGGRVWLAFGTDGADSHYPSFVYEYSPHAKEPLYHIEQLISEAAEG